MGRKRRKEEKEGRRKKEDREGGRERRRKVRRGELYVCGWEKSRDGNTHTTMSFSLCTLHIPLFHDTHWSKPSLQAPLPNIKKTCKKLLVEI